MPAIRASEPSIFDAVSDETLDEVTLALLVTARNEGMLYDLSRWGENVGIASKATFSRAKTTLEDEGILDTEKVPIDVGRPRQRLLLDHDGLAAADIDEFAADPRVFWSPIAAPRESPSAWWWVTNSGCDASVSRPTTASIVSARTSPPGTVPVVGSRSSPHSQLHVSRASRHFF